MGQWWSKNDELVAYEPIIHCGYDEKYYLDKEWRIKGDLNVKKPTFVDEFIHDGQEIMCIASIFEMGIGTFNNDNNLAKKYVHHAITTNPRYINLSVRNWEREDYIKFLFQMHAYTYNISLGDAIDKWLPKFERVYNGYFHTHTLYTLRKLKNQVNTQEWNAKFE